MFPYLGEVLALLSATSFAVFNVTISATKGSRGDKGVLFSVIVTIGFSFLLFLVLEAESLSISMNRDSRVAIAAFVFAGVSAMAFGRSLVFSSVRRLGPTRASAVKRLNPFFSVILAAFILSEPVTAFDLAGLIIIALAFALLVRDSMKYANPVTDTATPLAYGIGAAAALAYSVSYIARKIGLEHMDAPAFGTFLSAVSGFVAFALLALFSQAYRTMFRGVFANIDRPIILCAIFVSVGQILMFAALALASVSTVVIIASMEIFITIFLSWLVLGTEKAPSAVSLSAAALAVLGVILVAGG